MTKITAAELAAETAEALPDRDTLAVVNWAGVAAFNSSTAANVAALWSAAASHATQTIAVIQ
ncbi:hypothetical protein [Sinomonas humi]|uniref:Uncharacterized protein n=1 Tax=Sinomonas humi TaxID=1338436 RepID=A0A0B2ABV5_9MICC|nr:hypothetical protein [Sinomonas humi]KHL01070.1 hypothetical protein LK10_18180 [Sinomonas humi]